MLGRKVRQTEMQAHGNGLIAYIACVCLTFVRTRALYKPSDIEPRVKGIAGLRDCGPILVQ